MTNIGPRSATRFVNDFFVNFLILDQICLHKTFIKICVMITVVDSVMGSGAGGLRFESQASQKFIQFIWMKLEPKGEQEQELN